MGQPCTGSGRQILMQNTNSDSGRTKTVISTKGASPTWTEQLWAGLGQDQDTEGMILKPGGPRRPTSGSNRGPSPHTYLRHLCEALCRCHGQPHQWCLARYVDCHCRETWGNTLGTVHLATTLQVPSVPPHPGTWFRAIYTTPCLCPELGRVWIRDSKSVTVCDPLMFTRVGATAKEWCNTGEATGVPLP